MLFNSFTFWLFYACVLCLYYRLSHRGQNILLLLASYIFYACWDWRFLGLLGLSTILDYSVGRGLDWLTHPRARRALLISSLTTNLGILGFFKYYGFFSQELSKLLHTVGVPALLPTLDIILPVGISFYTFQTMSYAVDVYRREIPAARSLLDFAVYVSFFPQLVAGPIERARTFLPQVCQTRRMTPEKFRQGLYLILIGLFRKVVIADNMAPLANTIFSTPAHQLSGVEVLLGIYAFAFQIYGDFSGYSAMARGLANWMGFELSSNFNLPYFATSPSDFWQRWHISLSQWLRDYLYIPLGGNRHGTVKTYRNLMLTMLLGGLWHGAAWNYIAWGGLHGLMLCGYRVWEGRKVAAAAQIPPAGGIWWLIRVLVMFHLVCLTWLLFRAESITQVTAMLARPWHDLSITPFAVTVLCLILFYTVPLMLFEFWEERRGERNALLNVHWLARGAAYLVITYMLILFPPSAVSEFIYFQF